MSSNHGPNIYSLRRRAQATHKQQQRNEDPKKDLSERSASRTIESGLGVLDNNSVNFLMALVMSVGGMMVASWFWGLPMQSILKT